MLSRRILPQLNRSLRAVGTRAASTSTPVDPKSGSAEAATGIVNQTQDKNDVSTWQAPNHVGTWSTSQRPRPLAGSSPRFEQTDMDFQPQPLSAMEMIAQEPIRLVQGRKAVCDGGGGPLGHPKVYINLDKPEPRPCGYVGIRFQQDPHHHH
ncbi:NADH:ubiquinone oxidoreductase kDa subunit [Coprinellus micaceus]|uniref:NADH:ubiquinone oxidoreductase kDa subunit n=1 Tax=Coprinellus micaceus TaxID=71717 RepID=A0A4Y7TLJ8_COPMI|nr:NADH:ubiquinone oxidoreductase kDa subunit [Coprinellus micaceus]